MTRKTADDLADDPAAVGGAISQWPRRTLAWACREQRTESVDSAVISALLEREVRDLADLETKAQSVGIDPSGLADKRRGLENAGTDEVLQVLRQEYRAEYMDGDFGGGSGCPYEDAGMDKACWACPVTGRTVSKLAEKPAPEVDQ